MIRPAVHMPDVLMMIAGSGCSLMALESSTARTIFSPGNRSGELPDVITCQVSTS